MMKVMLVFGTRPEAIKMSPLVKKLKTIPEHFETIVCVTGQHREMLDQVLDFFEIKPDYDLNIMQKGQDLYDITAKILLGMRSVLDKVLPDIVLVHGDTTTSMAASLAAFYKQVKVGHIEAGLRTHNVYSPWPEEMNRQITGRISALHFAPTEMNRRNLLLENIDDSKIFVTGNTGIDALHFVIDKIKANPEVEADLQTRIKLTGYCTSRLANSRKLILITGHRRENFGTGFKNICMAIRDLAVKYIDIDFVYPMHLNPNVRQPIKEVFGRKDSITNLFFIEPLEYLSFVYLMEKSYIIMTDSGGVQEEAPSIQKPVLVMRDTTERPEAVIAGTVKLVGTNYSDIVTLATRLIEDSELYLSMIGTANPYGDGQACSRIVKELF